MTCVATTLRLLNSATNLGENGIGIRPNHLHHTNDNNQNDRKHDRVLGDILYVCVERDRFQELADGFPSPHSQRYLQKPGESEWPEGGGMVS